MSSTECLRSHTGWTDKYRPRKIDDVIGEHKKKVFDWVKKWSKKQPKKALLLVGPPGCGKTSLVNAIASELNLHVIETNASDVRTKAGLSDIFGNGLSQQTLFQCGKLVLFDEVDGISGQNDRGAPQEIVRIVTESNYPVILTANEFRTDGQKARLRILKKVANVVNIKPLETQDIVSVLRRIVSSEGFSAEDRALSVIARNAAGDLRSAITDIEAYSIGRRALTYDDVKMISYRDTAHEVKQAMTVVFKTSSAEIARSAFDNVDVEQDELIQWMRENVPREYLNARDFAPAMDFVSRADVFNGRISRQQYWGYLRHIYQLLSVGVAVSKTEKYSGVLDYHFPTWIIMMGQSKFTRAQDDALAAKLSPELHVSKHVARQYFGMLSLMQKHKPADYREFMAELDDNAR